MTSPVSGRAVSLEELRDALKIKEFRKRRSALRTLASKVLRAHITNETIEGWFGASPLVGDLPDQVDPRPTISGLRDLLSEETMTCLVFAEASGEVEGELQNIWNALTHPYAHAMPSTRSRTGFVFGRNQEHSEMKVKGIAVALEAMAEGEETMKKTDLALRLTEAECSLADLMNAVDRAVIISGHPVGAVLDVLEELIGEELPLRVRAVRAAATHRVSPITPSEITEPEALVELEKALVSGVTNGKSEASGLGLMKVPTGPEAGLIDLALKGAGLPPIEELIRKVNEGASGAVELAEDNERLRADLEAARRAASGMKPVAMEKVESVVGTTEQEANIVPEEAAGLFGITAGKDMFEFDVPVMHWDEPHPHVPEVDEDYIFRPMELFRVLTALLTDQRAYLHGHTGTGKTTLVEQVCARLGWPMMRVNFDSEITRMDLIGRDVLTEEGGVTVSRFVDGILPTALQGPYVMCLDEIDFVRPDIAYVLQRVLEGSSLMLTEDGGRMVHPHPMSRIIATGNTVGQGDEHGMYQGARVQSMALLNRFTVWAHVDYLPDQERKQLIQKRVPSLEDEMVLKIGQYVTEHLEAFTSAKVLQPITPRDFIALGQHIALWTNSMPASMKRDAVQQALEATVLDRATQQDRVTLAGIVSRVFG